MRRFETARVFAAMVAACLAAAAQADTASTLSLPPSVLPAAAAPAAAPRAAQAATSNGPALSMQAAVDRAVRWHPVLQNARSQLQQSNQGIETARSGYYPNVTAGVNAENRNRSFDGTDSRHQRRAEIQVSQMLYDFGKVGSEVAQATAASGAARAQVLLTFDQVILSTAGAWVEVRRNEALVKVAQEQADVLKSLTERVKERNQEGASTSSDVAQAQARVDAAQVQLLTARSQVQLWRTTLRYWAGTRALPRIAEPASPALEGACQAAAVSLASDSDAQQTLQSASSVQLAQAQLETAQAGLELADAQLRPTLSLSGSAGRRLGGGDNQDDGRNLDTSVMLNLSMPLYQGGRLQSGREAAGYGVAAARAALDQARLTTSQGWQSSVLQWQKFAGRAAVQAERQENMNITRALYHDQYLQLGTRSLLDLLNAEQEYYGALNDQIESEHEIIRQNAECLYYMGALRAAFGAGETVAQTVDMSDAPSGGAKPPRAAAGDRP